VGRATPFLTVLVFVLGCVCFFFSSFLVQFYLALERDFFLGYLAELSMSLALDNPRFLVTGSCFSLLNSPHPFSCGASFVPPALFFFPRYKSFSSCVVFNGSGASSPLSSPTFSTGGMNPFSPQFGFVGPPPHVFPFLRETFVLNGRCFSPSSTIWLEPSFKPFFFPPSTAPPF